MNKDELIKKLDQMAQMADFFGAHGEKQVSGAYYEALGYARQLPDTPQLQWQTGQAPHNERVLYQDTSGYIGLCNYMARHPFPPTVWVPLSDILALLQPAAPSVAPLDQFTIPGWDME